MAQIDHLRPVEEQDHASSRSVNREEVPPVPFEDIYQQHNQGIYRYCLARLADPAAPEEATANTFMKAFSAYSRLAPQSDGVRLWLFRIATNVVKDHHRRQGRRRRILTALAVAVHVGQIPKPRHCSASSSSGSSTPWPTFLPESAIWSVFELAPEFRFPRSRRL